MAQKRTLQCTCIIILKEPSRSLLQIGHLKFYTLAFWLFLTVYEVVLLSVVRAVEVVPDFCEPCVFDDDTGVTP